MKTLLLLGLFYLSSVVADIALEQLSCFKAAHPYSVGVLTSSNGAPVEMRDTRVLNSDLVSNEFFMDLLSHGMEERIPERVVHAKGAGAFGYFEVTHNVTAFCKAKLFSKIGKKTPVAVRFSQSSFDKGGPDTIIDSRGFAVKFYTEEGNFDIVGSHAPMFMFKEPFLFQAISKVIKRNPVTNLNDPNMAWDFITTRHELVNFFLYLYGKNGIPRGYRYMPGHSIHTYQIYNDCGKSYLARFHILSDLGNDCLSTEEAVNLMGSNPDYAVKDLYNAIACGDWPSWTVSWQLLTLEDAKKAKFDVFDLTKKLPEKDYPLKPIGKLVLNRNPENYFAEVEQLAFCPGNLVPGILGSPDKLFAARRFAYKDTQRYRLGVNFNRIDVNCPLSKLNVYDRDGRSPVGRNGGSEPSYYPNSYNGPMPYVDKNRPHLINITQYETETDNFMQATSLYNELCEKDREILVRNVVVWSLSNGATKETQQRVVKLFRRVHPDLGQRLQKMLYLYVAPVSSGYECHKSMYGNKCQ